ncbi:uncharacterized protein DFL_000378 [Arthrobotrys flagrans]|uniref:BTB domain-containing protein n=1 Tax=Arthrobotrys flagrans TaxID=97331 RepID=A0A437ADZ2_ARTFL|nr:hypothetical protein DFL_000378 [Arthrobotrys flagrans]
MSPKIAVKVHPTSRGVPKEVALDSNGSSSDRPKSNDGKQQEGSERINNRKSLSKLMRIRDDKSTSDVTLLVGKERTPFYLHKPILSAASDFLGAIFISPSRDGGHTIPLPMITPEAFEVITRWMYGGRLLLEPEYGPNVLDVFSGTKYLHLNDMRMKILDHVADLMEKHLSRPVMSQLTEEGKRITNEMNKVIRFFIQLCNISWEEDLGKLVTCAEWIIRGQDVDVESLVQALCKETGGRLFIAAIIQAGKNNGCAACDFAKECQGAQVTVDRIVGGVNSMVFDPKFGNGY